MRTIIDESDFQFSHFGENPFLLRGGELKAKRPRSRSLLCSLFFLCVCLFVFLFFICDISP